MGKKTEMQPACRDYTLNMHKGLQGIQFKKRAPRAIKNIRRFTIKEMKTREVRIDPLLTDRSGLAASGMFLARCVSESLERETRMRTPMRSSTLSFNSWKLTLSIPCRL